VWLVVTFRAELHIRGGQAVKLTVDLIPRAEPPAPCRIAPPHPSSTVPRFPPMPGFLAFPVFSF
jgi:hypothetical protein